MRLVGGRCRTLPSAVANFVDCVILQLTLPELVLFYLLAVYWFVSQCYVIIHTQITKERKGNTERRRHIGSKEDIRVPFSALNLA